MANPDGRLSSWLKPCSETPAAAGDPKRVAQPACERRPSSVSAADPKAIHGTGHQGMGKNIFWATEITILMVNPSSEFT
jgi:hypothetical protein